MKYLKHLSIITLGVLAIILCAVSFEKAYANPSQITRYQTATATTTVTYMTPGTATTTLSYDSQTDGSSPDNSAILFVQYTASTSLNILRARVEHSNDSIDWYPENAIALNGTGLTNNATSTQLVGDASTYKWQTATTTAITDGLAGSGTASRVHLSLPIYTPTRYTRVVFWNRAGEGNGALWAEITSKKENR